MTRSEQDYLKTIYRLGGSTGRIQARLVSEALDHSKPAVSEMFKRLVAKGAADYEPYQGIRLTQEGLQVALRVIRRHRLWELWLSKVLGFPLQDVHAEAEKLEHVMSDVLEKKLYDYLGQPEIDPHGHPIPDQDGRVLPVSGRPLTSFEAGQYIVLEWVEEDYELLSYFQSLGLQVGQVVFLEDASPYEGPLTIRTDDKRTIVGYKAATKIYARRDQDAS